MLLGFKKYNWVVNACVDRIGRREGGVEKNRLIVGLLL